MQIYITAAPGDVRAASAFGRPLAHAAYHIGPASTLLRRNPLLQSGGLLSVSDGGAALIEDGAELCAAVLRECSRRGFTGVSLDFQERPRRDRLAFAEKLQKALAERRLRLYVPESYAAAAPEAVVCIETALSGGNLKERLGEAAEQYHGQVALTVERLRMDFPLPCPTGIGRNLTEEEFRQLREEHHPSSYFSPDLCARYFTYRQNGETRFVLFDDADTFRRKLRLGTEAGYQAAFLRWSEMADFAADLLG